MPNTVNLSTVRSFLHMKGIPRERVLPHSSFSLTYLNKVSFFSFSNEILHMCLSIRKFSQKRSLQVAVFHFLILRLTFSQGELLKIDFSSSIYFGFSLNLEKVLIVKRIINTVSLQDFSQKTLYILMKDGR